MPGDEIFDSVRLRRDGVDFTQWPKLSCSAANQLDLDVSDLRLNGDRSLQFQGNGKISTAGSLRLFTDAPVASEKLSILANGNVGIGNPTPTTKLEVNGTIKATSFQGSFSGDGSALTNLSVTASQWQNGASSSISYSAGNVGIGVAPGYKLDVGGRMRVRQTKGNSTAGIWLSGYYRQEFDAAFVGMKSLEEVGFWGNTGAAGWRLFVDTSNGNLSVTGGAFKPGGGAWGSSSDKRLKDNIRPLTNALDRLLNLRGVVYEWKQPEKQGNLTGPQIGLIAQEVEEVFPDWVGVDSDGYKTLTIRGFEALTVEAFKQLKAENESLKARCETLEAKLEALYDRLQVIKSVEA